MQGYSVHWKRGRYDYGSKDCTTKTEAKKEAKGWARHPDVTELVIVDKVGKVISNYRAK